VAGAAMLFGVVGCELFDRKPRVSDKDLQYINFAQVKAVMAIDDQRALLVDARLPEDFNLAHIPGAVNIPSYEISGDDPRLSGAGTIIIYDSKDVPVGRGAAKNLMSLGFTNIRAYVFGLDDWVNQGAKLENADDEKVDRKGNVIE
jgi:rhodanese-related sulfurtransferase